MQTVSLAQVFEAIKEDETFLRPILTGAYAVREGDKREAGLNLALLAGLLSNKFSDAYAHAVWNYHNENITESEFFDALLQGTKEWNAIAKDLIAAAYASLPAAA